MESPPHTPWGPVPILPLRADVKIKGRELQQQKKNRGGSSRPRGLQSRQKGTGAYQAGEGEGAGLNSTHRENGPGAGGGARRGLPRFSFARGDEVPRGTGVEHGAGSRHAAPRVC